MTELIDGKKIAGEIEEELRKEIAGLAIVPGLAVILVGENPASQIYVRNKERAAEKVGIKSFTYRLEESVSQKKLLSLVEKLNENREVHGILIQLPLPKHIKPQELIEKIDPRKDVDCFHPLNIGQLTIGQPVFCPCTPGGIIEIMRRLEINLVGKHCVIVGRSNIVGKPLALLLLQEEATVTICHSKTKNLAEECLQADILVSAVGKAGLIKKNMIKPGAVVIDVGINKTEEGKVVGDVDFEEVREVTSWITPVPGGIGPMTITMLMKNTLIAAKNSINYH